MRRTNVCPKILILMLLCVEIFQGADIFSAKVNIEVQRASELAIAAIEKNGGVVTTSFYDLRSLGENFLSFLPCFGMHKDRMIQIKVSDTVLNGKSFHSALKASVTCC